MKIINIVKIVSFGVILVSNVFANTMSVKKLPIVIDDKDIWDITIKVDFPITEDDVIDVFTDNEVVEWDGIKYKNRYNIEHGNMVNGVIRARVLDKPNSISLKRGNEVLGTLFPEQTTCYEILEREWGSLLFGNCIQTGAERNGVWWINNKVNDMAKRKFLPVGSDSLEVYIDDYNLDEWLSLTLAPVQTWNNDLFQENYVEMGSNIKNWKREGPEFIRRSWVSLSNSEAVTKGILNKDMVGAWLYNEAEFSKEASEVDKYIWGVTLDTLPVLWKVEIFNDGSNQDKYQATYIKNKFGDMFIVIDYGSRNITNSDSIVPSNTINWAGPNGELQTFRKEELPKLIKLSK